MNEQAEYLDYEEQDEQPSPELIEAMEDTDFSPLTGEDEDNAEIAELLELVDRLSEADRAKLVDQLTTGQIDQTWFEEVVDAIYTCGLCGHSWETTSKVKRRYKGKGQAKPLKPAEFTTRTCDYCVEHLNTELSSLSAYPDGSCSVSKTEKINTHNHKLISYINSLVSSPAHIMRTS